VSDQVTPDLIIRAEQLTLRFGGVVSLRDVSFEMRRGEILAVIGPNGAARRHSSTRSPGSTNPKKDRSPSWRVTPHRSR